jgi:sortase A
LKSAFAALGVALTISTVVSVSTARASTTFAPPAGWPRGVEIQKINVNAPVVPLDLYKLGPLDQTPPWADVGWWDKGAKPGHLGVAQIYGHVDTYSGPAVFWNLAKLAKGDTVRISYGKGAPLTFRVLWSKSYPSKQLPMNWMLHARKERALALITCAGVFRGQSNGGYDHKLLVYARLVLPNGHLG